MKTRQRANRYKWPKFKKHPKYLHQRSEGLTHRARGKEQKLTA